MLSKNSLFNLKEDYESLLHIEDEKKEKGTNANPIDIGDIQNEVSVLISFVFWF